MNWDHIEGSWREFKGKVRTKWAKLTDDDMDQIGGKKDVFLGRLQQRYGFEKDRAERELDSWLGELPVEEQSAGAKARDDQGSRH